MESIPWNQFLGSLNIYKFGLCPMHRLSCSLCSSVISWCCTDSDVCCLTSSPVCVAPPVHCPAPAGVQLWLPAVQPRQLAVHLLYSLFSLSCIICSLSSMCCSLSSLLYSLSSLFCSPSSLFCSLSGLFCSPSSLFWSLSSLFCSLSSLFYSLSSLFSSVSSLYYSLSSLFCSLSSLFCLFCLCRIVLVLLARKRHIYIEHRAGKAPCLASCRKMTPPPGRVLLVMVAL